MKSVVVGLALALGALLFGGLPVRAQEVIIRAVLPNPVGDESGEWILLENTSQASVSGAWRVNDGAGQIKHYTWQESIDPGFRYIRRPDSAISLNNDLDWVELWLDDSLMDTCDPFENVPEGHIWTRLHSGWIALQAEEFETRLFERHWQVSAQDSTITSSPTPGPGITSSTPSPATAPSQPGGVKQGSGVPPPPILVSPTSLSASPSPSLAYQQLLVVPVLRAASHSADQTRAHYPPSPPAYPSFDGAAERTAFVTWQRQALAGSYALVFAGVCWGLVSVPVLIRWYNEKRCIW